MFSFLLLHLAKIKYGNKWSFARQQMLAATINSDTLSQKGYKILLCNCRAKRKWKFHTEMLGEKTC